MEGPNHVAGDDMRGSLHSIRFAPVGMTDLELGQELQVVGHLVGDLARSIDADADDC